MFTHQPVLLDEVIEHLAIKPNGIYIDATFGRGGHARAILRKLSLDGRLVLIDKDPMAIDIAKKEFLNDARIVIEQSSFAELTKIVDKYNFVGKISGILMDLGVSSPQLDDASRGFSFSLEGPLDMRMDTTKGVTAADWIAQASEKEIANVLFDFGEERFAKRIANAIVKKRAEEVFKTTAQLADVVAKANPKWERHKHPATRSFQAIRIFINSELNDLKTVLPQCIDALEVGGRLAIISFHSLEDRIVKQFFREQIQGPVLSKSLLMVVKPFSPVLAKIAGPVRASAEEVKDNPRARSAVLRVVEKIKE
ncbi:MAG: 16S rRNA (cytosine(1402)-N(4))-methyltransferase RsmH [Gammaproteobacteria bacterium]